MINDAFKLTIDQIMEKRAEDKVHAVKGYADNENMWDHLGQLMPNSHYSPKK
jgi:hypothetical protein